MVGTPAWWRSKCRSAGVTIPHRSWSGVSEMPWPFPEGMRRGRSNGERWPRSLVGWPGTLVGSGDATRGDWSGVWASPARRSASDPRAPAAPARRARREIGASVIGSRPVWSVSLGRPKLRRRHRLRESAPVPASRAGRYVGRMSPRTVNIRGGCAALACLAVGAPLLAQKPRLGTIDFPTSGAPAAQAQFVRGVLLLHSFEYQDAARAFRAAQSIDPGFALAYWGEALTYTHPVWNEQDGNAARAALLRLGPTPAARRAKALTPREKAYLDAVEILYGDGSKAARDTAYSLDMERVVTRFPADREAKVFYALSLLGLNQGVRDTATYRRAGAIVEPVFRANPNHPGAGRLLTPPYDA